MIGARGANGFDAMKGAVMEKLAEHRDKSPKGFLDAPILDMVCFINDLPDYVTTSSCSGRVALFHRDPDGPNKGGTWLLAKHAPLDDGELNSTLAQKLPAAGSVLLKHEPLVLHVQCRDAVSAQRMLRVAMASGMRESGISLGAKKTMLGIRTTANMLELPVAQNGQLLLSKPCMDVMQVGANERFKSNLQRTNIFFTKLRAEFDPTTLVNNKEEIEEASTNVPQSDGLWRLARDVDGKALDSSVLRWGHTATTVNQNCFDVLAPSIVIFGGLGLGEPGAVSQRRLNDVLRLTPVHDSDTFVSERLSVGGAPAPAGRVRHSASLIHENKIVFFGGRASPVHPFGDVAVLDVSCAEPKWLPAVTFTNSDAPSARWSHGSAVIGDSVYVFGGRDSTSVFSDLWKLDISNDGSEGKWECIKVANSPGPRFMHAMLALSDCIVVYGGMHTRYANEAQGYDGSIFIFNTSTCVWKTLSSSVQALPARFGHTAVAWTQNEFIVAGGVCKDTTNNGVCIITVDTDSTTTDTLVATAETLASNDKYAGSIAPYCMLQRSALAVLPAVPDSADGKSRRLVAVGGGALCFSFGFQFSPAIHMSEESLIQLRSSGQVSGPLASTDTVLELLLAGDHLGRTDRNEMEEEAAADVGVVETRLATQVEEFDDVMVRMVYLPAKSVKAAKVALESRGWLDKRFRICKKEDVLGTGEGGVLMGLPLINESMGMKKDVVEAMSEMSSAIWVQQQSSELQLSKRTSAGAQGVNVKGKSKRRSVNAAVHGEVRLGIAVSQTVSKPLVAETTKISRASVAKQAKPSTFKSTVNNDPKVIQIVRGGEAQVLAVIVERTQVHHMKRALEACGWFEKNLRVKPSSTDTSCMAVPLSENASAAMLAGNISGDFGPTAADTFIAQHAPWRLVKEGGFRAAARVLAVGGKVKTASMVDRIEKLAKKLCGVEMTAALQAEIPAKVERLADVGLIPVNAFKSREVWRKVFDAGKVDEDRCVWRIIARELGVNRVVLSAEIDSGLKRESRSVLVFPRQSSEQEVSKGEQTCWIEVKQNGIWYELDVLKVMFSSGNITEKARVGKLPVKGETIVDLYAGIGYFTLPYLLNGKAAMVHACEWNPHSLEALNRNLARNGVADRCKVYPGDNAVSAQQLIGVADRVNLGLIPTSEMGWPSAVDVLKPTGGWMHVHDNVRQDEKDAWVVRLESTLKGLLDERKPSPSVLLEWRVQVQHVEKVKSYAPRVYHYVADVRCALEPVDRDDGVSQEVRLTDQQQSGAASASAQPSPSFTIREITSPPQSLAESEALYANRQPFVVRGGAPVSSVHGLAELCKRDTEIGKQTVSVHVAPEHVEGRLSFVNKNFLFENMPLSQLMSALIHSSPPSANEPVNAEHQLKPASQEGAKAMYLRAVGPNPRKDRADVWRDFKGVAEWLEMSFPETYVAQDKYFSSVLRVATAGLQLWTHYDVMDNILFQSAGTKTVVLFHPDDIDCLYMNGSSSRVVDINAQGQGGQQALDVEFPRFAAARARAVEVKLHPGDALFIPALWPHNAHAEEASLAVNVFFRHLETPDAYQSKDLYGNRDPRVAEEALGDFEKGCDRLAKSALPRQYVKFYAKLGAELMRSKLDM